MTTHRNADPAAGRQPISSAALRIGPRGPTCRFGSFSRWSPQKGARGSVRASALGLALALPLAAFAQDTVDPASVPPSPTLEELEQAHRILERNLELEREQTEVKAKAAPTVSASEKGFALKTADGAFQLKIRGLVQVDGRAYLNEHGLPLADTFLLRRVRPILDAVLANFIDLRLMPDFGNGQALLYDAYADVRFRPWLRLRIGKFKPAVGLERLQSASTLHFIERAFPTSLVPNRDVGLQLTGETTDGSLALSLGAFNGVVDGALGDLDNNEAKDVVGRIFVHPFRPLNSPALRQLGLGLSGTFGRQNGSAAAPSLPTFRGPGQQAFFTYAADALPDGARRRLSPQLYYYVGPFGLLGEFVLSQQQVARATNRAGLATRAWQGTVSWVLTGEDSSYQGVAPAHSFSLEGGHLGALELVARVQELRVDPAAFPTFHPAKSAERARGYGGGLNWTATPNARVSLNFDHTDFVGGATGGDRPAENALAGRFQASF